MMHEKDDYSKISRTYPAIIILFELAILFLIIIINNFNQISTLYKRYENFIFLISRNHLFINFSKALPLAFLFFWVFYSLFCFIEFLIREVGKFFSEVFIMKFWRMPTTRLLCKECKSYTDEIKRNIFIKINIFYNIDLIKIQNKSINNKIYIKTVDSVVDLIREDTRNNKILFKYNKIYGFWRNLSGGEILFFLLLCLMGLFDLFNKQILLFHYKQFLTLTSLLLVLIIISFFATFRNGIVYAKQLYAAFLTLPPIRKCQVQ